MAFSFWGLFKKKPEEKSSFSQMIAASSGMSNAGVSVTWETALQSSVVSACVDVIARGVAQVPFRLMRKANKMRDPATGKELYWLIARGPNPYQSDYEFRYTLAQHAALTGNAFIWLNRVNGKIKEMFPIRPGNVTIVDDDSINDGWRKRYLVSLENGRYIEIPHEDMWVIKWRSFDGIKGLDSVRLAREAIGLSMAGEAMASNLYSKGSNISGYLSSEKGLSEEARNILRTEWTAQFSGTNNAGRTPVLSGDLKFVPVQKMTAQEAQLIDNRNFQIPEICRLFGVQPIMVYHYLNATTYASVEQMFMSHIVHTMAPWYRMIESSANKHLLTDDEFKRGYYFKFFEQGLLRGDMDTMANWFLKNIQNGILTPNEAREYLDLNPYEGGDIHLVPLNLSTPEKVMAEPYDNSGVTVGRPTVENPTVKKEEENGI